MSDPVQDSLVEAVLSPHRSRDPEGRPVPPPAWWDLSPEVLEEVHRRGVATRRLERALDPQGLSGTARAVMARIRGEEGPAPAPPEGQFGKPSRGSPGMSLRAFS